MSTQKEGGVPDGLPPLPEAPPSRHIGQGYSFNHPVPTIKQYQADLETKRQEAEEYAKRMDALEEKQAAARLQRFSSPESNVSDDVTAVGADRMTESHTSPPTSPGANGNSASPNYSNILKSGGALASVTSIEEPPVGANSEAKFSNISTRPGGHKSMRIYKKDGKPSETVPKSKNATEKEEMMDRMNANKEKPTERLRKRQGGERRVRDPTTGGEVIIRDADPKDFDSAVPSTKPSNVLLHPFPPPRPASMNYVMHKFQLLGIGCAAGLAFLWMFTAFGHGFWRFARVSFICGAVGTVLVTLVSLISRSLDKEIEKIRLDMHRQRGEVYSPPTPESVEWLNSIIKLVWGLVNPQMFVPIADMVEDIMQQSLPGFVDAVRISDIGQGVNPLRILSIRALADMQTDPSWPRKHWINKGDNDQKTKNTSGDTVEEDEAGDYYNFEVSFAYTSLPGQDNASRSHNIHLLIEFFLGMYDWLHIPIPIWIQVEGIVGTVRLRVQMIPEAPFVRNLTFALCGVPHVEISAIPMSKRLPNVLDLPFISSFVKMAISAGTAELCAPKSMTLNLQEMLSGAALGDTRAVGIFVITIHYAENLSAQDNNGKSDPYIVVAYAKFGKPLYSTRIITEDLNPVFEETTTLLLTEDEIKSKEDVSLMLWDSDKHSADDLIGRVQVPVTELMKQPNQMVRRTDDLKGFEDADDMQGELHWSIGYFTKAALRKELERELTEQEKKAQPPPSKTAPEMEMRPNDAAPNPAKKDLPPPPPDVEKTRPDPEWPSGVFSVIVHQITNLERQQLDGKKGKDREGQAGQDTDDPSQATDNLPSGYCEVIVDDELCYKTRVKQYTNNPYYEAGTEIFLRNFNDGVIRVVVRDSRLREADPILGLVSLRTADIFKTASSVTQTYALTEGVGFGKIHLSFAFRGMQVKLPPNQLGWSIGTLHIGDLKVTLEDKHKSFFHNEVPKLSIRATDTVDALSKKDGEADPDGSLYWDTDDLRLPIYTRFSSSCVFEFGVKRALPLLGKKNPEAISVLWLQDLTNDVEQEVKIPIFTGPDLANLRQNAINDQTAKHHDFELIGFMTAILRLDSGIDLEHERLRATLSQARRHALEAYYHIEGQAEIAERNAHFADDGVIDKHEKKELEKAHKRQLISRGRGPAQLKAYRQLKWMEQQLCKRRRNAKAGNSGISVSDTPACIDQDMSWPN